MKTAVLSLAFLLLTVTAFAGTYPRDECQSATIGKTSTPITIASATTTSLISGVAGEKISVCTLSFSLGGTAPTFQLVEGTQVATPCDTGQIAISGVFTDSSVLPIGFSVPAGNSLCAITTGITPTAGGLITFIQNGDN